MFLTSCTYKVYKKDYITDENDNICECEYIIIRNDLKKVIIHKGMCCEFDMKEELNYRKIRKIKNK
jgi:hypothetical protein